MKYAVYIAALMILATGVINAQRADATSRTDDLREIERLEVEWNTINEISDAEGKERLLADDSYHVGPSGRLYNKAQDIEAMVSSRRQKQSTNRILRFMTLDRRIRLYKDVAVVTLTATSISTQDGKETRGKPFRSIHVWEKRDGRWFLTIDQVTAINLF